jgi:hypothetical protein
MNTGEQDREELSKWKAPDNSPAGLEKKITTEKEAQEKELFAEGWDSIEQPKFDSQGRATLPDKPKTWNRVNYAINALRADGTKYARPYEDGVEDQLQAVGFSKDEKMSVVYANDLPTHPEAIKRWKDLIAQRDARTRPKETGSGSN